MPADPAKPETVLVVEDDPGTAELEALQLHRAGYRVLIADSPEEALEHLKRGGVDLVLLDHLLPGSLDGLDFYHQLRASGYDLPVILVTGFGDQATLIRALRAGVRDFISKTEEYLEYLPEAIDRTLRQIRTEARLAESEARLAGVIASAKDAIIVAGADRRITLFNPAAEQMFRCRAADALDRRFTDFIPDKFAFMAGHPDGADPSSLSARLRTGTKGIRANGEEFPLEASVSSARVNGRRLYTIVVRDVTERVRAEAALRASEERFRSFVETTNEWVWACDVNGVHIYSNPAIEPILGYPPEEIVGHNFRELMHPDDIPVVNETLARAAANRQGWSGVLLRWKHRDGRYRQLESAGRAMFDSSGRLTGFQGSDRDITDRLRLEAQYRQAQKMESIGRLAGGVAHDFNNLLTVICGFADILLESARPGDPSYSLLQEIRKAGDRAATLTRQLLAFSRQQVLQPRVLDLNALVNDMRKMLHRMIGEDIELTVALDPKLGRVEADPGQLEQVLMNLCVNARDAMPTGGRLTIETRSVELDASYVAHHAGIQPGPYVLLAVTDTGHGMDEATRTRIFEPFFTTKEQGKGTGLGLATVYGIVKQSGGHVDVYSELGIGTTFKVYLPRVAEAGSSSRAPQQDQTIPRGTETVLVAEDNDSVRALTSLVLRSYGYTVLEARDGEAALRICQEHPEPIHLLLTDVVMPRLSGRQLAEQVAAVRPDLRVLFMSGYTDDAVVRHGIIAEGVAFLQKPITPIVLGRKVREILDGKGAARTVEP